ncbi:MAG: hypothetical protein COA79_00165 [Planctomycetota bacterium]|nr:MAG: hypothetical protein COA79_00165 [Planctomycetota bacterium]
MVSILDLSLSEVELFEFNSKGFTGPFRLFKNDHVNELNKIIDEKVFNQEGPNPNNKFQSRHMDIPQIYQASIKDEICEKVASILGEDLIMWASYFFEKQPGGLEIPWHQDINYWPLEPAINISAWIALDLVTTENSCVQLIPGSHKKKIPHIEAPKNVQFGEMADPKYFDESEKVNIQLKPGEYFLFNEKMLHKSDQNNSALRRRGMTFRYSIPSVKVFHGKPPLHKGHKAILAKGIDTFGFNQYC